MAARLLGVSTMTLRRWRYGRVGPQHIVLPRGGIRYALPDLEVGRA
jgi:hypothetical protein